LAFWTLKSIFIYRFFKVCSASVIAMAGTYLSGMPLQNGQWNGIRKCGSSSH